MVYMYLGTPGSGKSYHATARIFTLLRNSKVNIICNYPVDIDQIFLTRVGYWKKVITSTFSKIQFRRYDNKPRDVHFSYVDNSELTVEYLKEYCYKNHKRKTITIGGTTQTIMPEDQTLVIIDEAAVMFNCRDWGDKRRQEWCKFFAQHRHYGFNFILITQNEQMIDKQIRALVEVYVMHRNLRYYNLFAKLLSFLAGGSLFMAISRWQGVKEPMSRDICRYNKRIASIYNSYMIFDQGKQQAAADGCSPQGEGPTAAAPACMEEVKEDVEPVAS